MSTTTNLTFTLSIPDLLNIPYDGCNHLINHASASGQLTPEILRELYDLESQGKARWPVMNNLRRLMTAPPKP